jgi:hypothetical protein
MILKYHSQIFALKRVRCLGEAFPDQGLLNRLPILIHSRTSQFARALHGSHSLVADSILFVHAAAAPSFAGSAFA